MPLLTAILGVIASFFPARYRQGRWGDSVEATTATLSGIAECLCCAFWFVARLIEQFNSMAAPVGMAILNNSTKDVDGRTLTLTTGVLGLANFMFQPANLLLFYLAAEGAVRALAALFSDQFLPTLPLSALARLHDLAESFDRYLRLGPRVVDRIEAGDGTSHDLRVMSCRPKENWNRLITIRFRDESYILVGQDAGEKPRPFIYRLRKNPIGRLVLVIRDYSLEEA
jgi:hypothetical protein